MKEKFQFRVNQSKNKFKTIMQYTNFYNNYWNGKEKKKCQILSALIFTNLGIFASNKTRHFCFEILVGKY